MSSGTLFEQRLQNRDLDGYTTFVTIFVKLGDIPGRFRLPKRRGLSVWVIFFSIH